VLAKRPPGSVFKTVCLCGCAGHGGDGRGNTVFTPASMVDDEPVTLISGGELYTPGNFHGEDFGELTFRDALAHSDNIGGGEGGAGGGSREGSGDGAARGV